MKYTITPLNVLMVIYAIRAVYKYLKMTHDDGLALTGLVMVFGIVLYQYLAQNSPKDILRLVL